MGSKIKFGKKVSNVDIIEFTKRFHALEVVEDLFLQRDNKGLYYWDIVRYDIYHAVYYELNNVNKIRPAKKGGVLLKLANILKYGYHSIKLSITLKAHNYDYLCFSCSRYKTPENKNVDYALNDILSLIEKKKTLILETNIQFNESYRYHSFFNVEPLIQEYRNKLKNCFNIERTFSYQATKIIQHEFGINLDFDVLIKTLINKYNSDYTYYMKLLKQLRPKKIFIVQNGIQKALFKAANVLDLPTYEMQHGLVNFIHPVYYYPRNADLSHLDGFPTYFLTFSSFWANNINYPVCKVISVGNTFFSQKLPKKEIEFDVTIISANIYALDFIALINDLLATGFNGRIALKLHPNQFSEIEYIRNHFLAFSNIEVIFAERTIKELLQVSNAILAVQSTCVYEALSCQVKVLIYKIKEYKTHEDIFDNPNVYQFTDSSEIAGYLRRDYICNTELNYFDEFENVLF